MAIQTERIDAALSLAWEREKDRCAADPEYYIFKYCRTRDEHDRTNPVKTFPDKQYLRLLLREWHDGPRIQFVAKSRQLMVSWLLCAYADWTIRFNPYRLVLFQSKKAEDAYKMVFFQSLEQARCSFIAKHLPPWLQVCRGQDEWMPVNLPACVSEGALNFPNGSRTEAIPQGPTQIESRVPSLWLCDAASLQEEWRAGYAAASPCLLVPSEEESGRGIIVATMRMPSEYGEEIKGAGAIDPDSLARGMARFKSTSGVSTMRVHYSADPDKDPLTDVGAAWLQSALSGYPGGMGGVEWQQHMEINPMARSGERVFPFWHEIAPRIVIPAIPVEEQLGWRYDSGLDWGARNHSVWQVYGNDYHGNRYMAYELSVPGNEVGGILGFCELMKKHDLFHRVNGKIHADPSLWNKDQNTKGGLVSKAQLFSDNGVYLVPAKAKGQEADDILVNRLRGYYWANADSDDFDPRLFIFDTCTATIRTWPLLRYEEWTEHYTGDRARSLKETIHNYNVDQWDAAKYAESARPEPQHVKMRPPPGSFEHLRSLIRANRRQGGKGSFAAA